MPPKKKVGRQQSLEAKLRREFLRKRKPIIPTTVIDEVQEEVTGDLYASRYAVPVCKKRAVRKKTVKQTFSSPNNSDCESRVSSEDEDAVEVKLPEPNKADDDELNRMLREQDSVDDVSIVYINQDNIRIKVEDGKYIGPHENQLNENEKPAQEEEQPGNFPKMNKPHKPVNHEIKPKEKKKKAPIMKPVPAVANKTGGWNQLIHTFRMEQKDEKQKTTLRKEAVLTGRVFSSPARLNLHKNDRLSMFSYTPIQGNHQDMNNPARFSTSSPFSPKAQFASTPMVKAVRDWKTERPPVFDMSSVMDVEAEQEKETMTRRSSATVDVPMDTAVDLTIAQKAYRTAENLTIASQVSSIELSVLQQQSETTSINEKNSTMKNETEADMSMVPGGGDGKDSRDSSKKSESSFEKSAAMPSRNETAIEDNISQSPVQATETIADATAQQPTEVVHEDETVQIQESNMSRKAETSMTEVLGDSEEELMKIPDESMYLKKRQRTRSPETMCQEASTIMTVATVQDTEEKENEAGGRKRGTLQPQKQQLLRESRLSTMTTASSKRDSINSLLEDMSIHMSDDDDELNLMRSMVSEGTTRLDSRNLGTGMTIRHEDPDAVPFYLEGLSFIELPSPMETLLHVNGQTAPEPWSSLPKSALDGRTVKKLGEGTYGEVYSTKWDGKPVAIKVVPFEESEEKRRYNGEYHITMQTAEPILPEAVIIKELSKLNDLSLEYATPNFISLVSLKIVKGLYPKGFIKAWDAYDKVKTSENTCPEIYGSKEQLYEVFVTENGGVALDEFVLKTEHELRSIILQLMISMEVAENALEFEHRDLHLGNVLVDRNGVEELTYKVAGHEVKIFAHGVKVNIIDFTLGRIKKDGSYIYSDLENDPEMFMGTEGVPQFDLYRAMRANCNGNWETFERKTNVMWIEYIANQLIDNEDICPSDLFTDERKEKLRQLFVRLGKYNMCNESFTDSYFFTQFYQSYLKDYVKE